MKVIFPEHGTKLYAIYRTINATLVVCAVWTDMEPRWFWLLILVAFVSDAIEQDWKRAFGGDK